VAAARHGPACAPLRSPARALAGAGEATWAWAFISPSCPGQKKPSDARLNLDHQIAIDGCAWISAEQKTPRVSPSLTLAHSLPPTPRRLLQPHPSTRVSGGRRRPSGVACGATVSPLASARAHRKVCVPPSSGITVVHRSTAR
jgi:hypothetical protein